MTDLVAVWEVALSDGVHRIEFEHGTTSGKRVVYVDGKVKLLCAQIHCDTDYISALPCNTHHNKQKTNKCK